MTNYAYLVISVFIIFNVSGQDGYMDSTFSNDGIVQINRPSPTKISAVDIAASDSGQIIVSFISDRNGIRKNWLVALKANGEIDSSFSYDGWQQVGCADCSGYGLRYYGNGKYFGYGTKKTGQSSTPPTSDYDINLIRFNRHGTVELDTLYDFTTYDGIVDLEVQSSGKLVLVAVHGNRALMSRINYDGIIDNAFGDNGVSIGHQNINARNAILVNDTIILGGAVNYFNLGFLLKFYENGKRDTTFGVQGKYKIPESEIDNLRFIAKSHDSRIIVLGTKVDVTNFVLFKYKLDGTLDTSFGDVGYVILPESIGINKIQVLPDGKILTLGSYYSDHLLYRYNVDGTVDSTFGIGGKAVSASDMSYLRNDAIQLDGKILTVGLSDFLTADTVDCIVYRYNTGINIGIEENSLIANKAMFYPNPFSTQASLEFELKKSSALTIELFDLAGKRQVMICNHKKFEAGKNVVHLTEFEKLSTGVYFVVISNATTRVPLKIIKSQNH